ncbi:MAG: ATP synthase F1 subunit gamma [Patescibacteria group bacterium]
MPVATRDIKRRIRSVGNSRKITKAMELVAAAKMRKAVNAVLETRDYANTAWEIIRNVAQKTDPAKHPLLRRSNKIKKVGMILITSNRGLCGGFNREIIETVAAYMREHKKENIEVEAEVFLLGKRGRDIMFKHGHEIIAEFSKLDVATRISEVTSLAKSVMADYVSKKYDKVVIAYTDYKSAIKQIPTVKKLLPIEKEDNELGFINGEKREEQNEILDYTFEPNPDAVLDQMLARLIELQIYQALLESNASEHSARMFAMRNASDAAGDMIQDLTFAYNQARQEAITTELADISGGRSALED